jgi:hypothetical protein
MRLRLGVGALLLALSGCVGPHSTGSLWVLQNTQLDAELFRTSDAQRAVNAHAYELTLAQQVIDGERARLGAALQTCPSAERQPLQISAGDRGRDRARLWIADDGAMRQALANVALADWRLRRANATGETARCDGARAALDGQTAAPQNGQTAAPQSGQIGVPQNGHTAATQGSRSPLIDGLGVATVTRSAVQPFEGAVSAAWMLYGLGMVDGVTAQGPLPEYLAAVYGGRVTVTANPERALSDADAQAMVDQLAPAYPEWEPDALYAALRPSQSQ